MIGRAYLWGLAANGQAGVENVLDLLRDGLGSAMLGLGPLLGARPQPRRRRRSRPASSAISVTTRCPTPRSR